MLCALLISAMLPGRSWQNLHGKTLQIRSANLTVPCPRRQCQHTRLPGQCLSGSCKAHEVAFTAKPSEFSADISVSNCSSPIRKTEKAISFPPHVGKPNATDSIFSLGGCRDAGHLLDPQPVADRSFCAQGLAGRRWSPGRSLIPNRPCRCYIYSLDGLSL